MGARNKTKAWLRMKRLKEIRMSNYLDTNMLKKIMESDHDTKRLVLLDQNNLISDVGSYDMTFEHISGTVDFRLQNMLVIDHRVISFLVQQGVFLAHLLKTAGGDVIEVAKNKIKHLRATTRREERVSIDFLGDAPWVVPGGYSEDIVKTVNKSMRRILANTLRIIHDIAKGVDDTHNLSKPRVVMEVLLDFYKHAEYSQVKDELIICEEWMPRLCDIVEEAKKDIALLELS
jgi:hypothetical protein